MGVRVKLKYDDYHKEIEDVIVSDHRLGDISEVVKSKMYDYTSGKTFIRNFNNLIYLI